MVAAAVLLIMVLLGIFLSNRLDDDRFIEKQLRGVQTSAEEEAAFERIRDKTYVGFEPLDTAGDRLDMSKEKWWKRAVTIRFYCKNKTIDHKLISQDNLAVLTVE